MKYLLTMFLFASLLAGCSPASSLENATQEVSPVVNHDTVSATTVPTQKATMQDATSIPQPLTIKVGPPKIPIAPIQGTPGAPVATSMEGWQTFTSKTKGVAVDYPANWSAIENDTGVKFTDPQGQLILLQPDQSIGSASTSGPDCVTLINSYGVTGDICHDTTTSTYRAVFKRPADASAAELALSTISQDKPTVFLQMFNSFRFTP